MDDSLIARRSLGLRVFQGLPGLAALFLAVTNWSSAFIDNVRKSGLKNSVLLLVGASFVFCLCVFFIIRLFDGKPLFALSQDGLWIRKSRMPFAGMDYLPWERIGRYQFTRRAYRGLVVEKLSLYSVNPARVYVVTISNLDVDPLELKRKFKGHTWRHEIPGIDRGQAC
ncbi:MAG: hypothetical protein EOO15_24110 [Chitinophagaceae bacterium]|nr:MAG: hypothetical protein EOO15_24110 [Chitinophagaceae bacterium]